MDKSYEKYSELFDLVRRGYLYKKTGPKYSNGVAYFYLITKDGKREKSLKMRISKNELDELKISLGNYMKSLHGKKFWKPSKKKEKGRTEKEDMHEIMKRLDQLMAQNLSTFLDPSFFFTMLIPKLGLRAFLMLMS